MTQEHPITPPPELVEQWRNLPEYVSQLRVMSTVTITTERLQHIATQAARWGADQELEACCEWMDNHLFSSPSTPLRAARRPSLQEQALLAIDTAVADGRLSPDVSNVIRRALEALDD